MSREALLEHHNAVASHVSLPLPEIEELSRMLMPYFDITVSISNAKMYQIVGKKDSNRNPLI